MKYLTRLHIAIADYKWRKIQARLFSKMKHVGKNVHICPNWKISSPQIMCIGNNVWIGENFFAKAEGNITIGSGTILSRNVEIWTSNHNYNSKDLQSIPYDKRMVLSPVVIGENVWVGTHALFLPGVTIGEGAVIGAGSVVTRDVPPLAVVGGNPSSILKFRDSETYYKLKANGKIYLDIEYDYDRSSLRKSDYWRKNEQ